MSVKVHESFSIDSFQDRLLWWDDFLGDQLKDEWRDAGTGSAVVIDAQTGGIVRLTSGATSGNAHQLDWNDIRSLHINKKVTGEARLKLSSITNLGTSGFYLLFDGDNRIQFLSSGANWQIRTEDNNVGTIQDSGIASDTDYHIFRIECFPTDEVHFYIDGVEAANSPITTNIPDDAGDFLQPFFIISTAEDANKSMDIDYVVIRQEI